MEMLIYHSYDLMFVEGNEKTPDDFSESWFQPIDLDEAVIFFHVCTQHISRSKNYYSKAVHFTLHNTLRGIA